MSLPNAAQVTNLYLYGTLNTPNILTGEERIRPQNASVPPVQVDINTYMEGPGRFATPDKFDVVRKFLNPLTDLFSFQLAPGEYSKQQLFALFGIEVGFITIDQAQHDDGNSDFLDRAYIWNTTAFKVADGATFVVEQGGNRYITNFAIVPHLNGGAKENFDFNAGSFFGGIANTLLQPKIDPSNIGLRVDFDFVGTRLLKPTFSFDNYVAASTSAAAAPSNPLLYAAIIANAPAFLDQLYNAGITKFQDDAGRGIIYGTDAANNLHPEYFGLQPIDTSFRNAIETRGVTLVSGKGNDTLQGGIKNDLLLGGQDFDTYQYTAGGGRDTIQDSDGSGRIVMDGQTLGGGAQFGDNRVYRDAQGHTYTQLGGNRLAIDGKLLVENWAPGQLGIGSGPRTPPSRVVASLDIEGDLAWLDLQPQVSGITPGWDAQGNYIRDPNQPEPGMTDVLNDSAGNDNIQSRAGNDTITAFRGGDDLIDAGSGQDRASAGSGDDLVVGGAGVDILAGEQGNDQLFAEQEIDIDAAIATGNTQAGRSAQGDWLNGGAGADQLVGSDARDVLLGGGGKDLILGGVPFEITDMVQGDAHASRVVVTQNDSVNLRSKNKLNCYKYGIYQCNFQFINRHDYLKNNCVVIPTAKTQPRKTAP